MEEHLYATLFTAYCARHRGACSDEHCEEMARVAKGQAAIAAAVFREKPKKLKGPTDENPTTEGKK